MNFYSSCSANRPKFFSGCDKQIWIEKSSFYSTKAPLISVCRFSSTYDEVTAFISKGIAFLNFFQTRFKQEANSVQTQKVQKCKKCPGPWLRKNAVSTNQRSVICPVCDKEGKQDETSLAILQQKWVGNEALSTHN